MKTKSLQKKSIRNYLIPLIILLGIIIAFSSIELFVFCFAILFTSTFLYLLVFKNHRILSPIRYIKKNVINKIKKIYNSERKQIIFRVRFSELMSTFASLITIWFLVSMFIVLPLYCINNCDGLGAIVVPILIFLYPVFIILTILDKITPIFIKEQITKLVSESSGTNFLFIGLFLVAITIAYLVLFIKNNFYYFKPRKQIIFIFLIVLLLFSPISFYCETDYDKQVNDPTYCPVSGESSHKYTVNCEEEGAFRDYKGKCYKYNYTPDYECNLCKYPIFLSKKVYFVNPTGYSKINYYLLVLGLILFEYLFSCIIYHSGIYLRKNYKH